MFSKILIIGYVWPEPQSSAAGLRGWNLVNTFFNHQWKVLFASPSKENIYSQRLRHAGIETFSIAPNDPLFDEFLKTQNPDFVVFDRFVTEEQFGWRVQESCPDAIRVLDTQDLHFLRRGREAWLKRNNSDELPVYPESILISEDSMREIASIYRCDSTLVLSQFELELLTTKFNIPIESLLLSRFHYSNPPIGPGFSERKDFVLIGNFRHSPNADGILWFHQFIWPSIRRKIPDANVFVYGAYPPKQMMDLTNASIGFHVKGYTPDQFDTLRKYRVNLAPLRFGAGIKGKITDGWWSGTPVVTTPIGAEGMGDQFPWGGEIAKTSADFIDQAISLYLNESRWNEAQSNGYQILRNLYSADANSKALISHFLSLRKNLKSIREKNFIGSMLNYHMHRSTKYFSKWIEAKNRSP